MMPSRLVRALTIFVISLSCASAWGDDVNSLVAKGDPLDQANQANAALKFYLPALKEEPDNVDLLCRVARQYRHLLADAPGKTEKLRMGEISLKYAKKAAELAPHNSEAQLSPGISYGKMLPYMSPKEQVAATPLIKDACDRAIALDPLNDNAWHILGRWDRTLANVNPVKRVLADTLFGQLPTATNEQAEKCLLKAIAINPHRLIHYIELGHIYYEMGRKDEAKKYIEKGLAMPNTEKDDPEEKEVGRELLSKMS